MRGISHNELSRRAGLSLSHVNVMLTRLNKEPDARFELETMKKLAHGGGVSLHWLITGEGERDLPDIPNELAGDPYPNRARAITWLRGEISERAIAYVRNRVLEPDMPQDMPVAFWASDLWAAEQIYGTPLAARNTGNSNGPPRPGPGRRTP